MYKLLLLNIHKLYLLINYILQNNLCYLKPNSGNIGNTLYNK